MPKVYQSLYKNRNKNSNITTKYSSLPTLNIEPTILRKILRYPAQHKYLYDHYGNFYTQTVGVAMGAPLGPSLSNFCIVYSLRLFFK